MSTVAAINALAVARPTAGASDQTVAQWYERKAEVLGQIADASDSRSERDTFRSFANQAHQHALRLLAPREDVR